MQACGVFGTTAIAALTAQNTHGVQAVHVTPTDMLTTQVRHSKTRDKTRGKTPGKTRGKTPDKNGQQSWQERIQQQG